MFVKFSAYFILVFLLVPHISFAKLADSHFANIATPVAIMVTITSFGYAAIVPSLRIYFAGDIQKLKKAIYIGSLIPLLCYIAWDAVIMGVIPLSGPNGLLAIFSSNTSNSDLVNTLSNLANNPEVTFFVKLFTSICVLTSFLGVSLCLTDFLADGLKLDKAGPSGLFIHVLTFLPPLIIVIFFPGTFIKALTYAGIYCVILLILLPAWMAWRGRDRYSMKGDFRVRGGKPLLVFLIGVSCVLIIQNLFA